MKKAIVVCDSRFGNTEKIARALARGLKKQSVGADCVRVDEVDLDKLGEYDLLAIGGPTHMIGMSEPMKNFMKRLETVDIKGKIGFAFDTRNESRMNKRSWFMLENSAAKRIEGKMKGMKVRIVKPRESALVNGREGPLEEGMEERFERIGAELAESTQEAAGSDKSWE